MANNQNYGYGKVILFGEHFVVHGLPAIAAALSLKTTANITLTKTHETNINKYTLIDNRPKINSFKPTKTDKYLKLVQNIFAQANNKARYKNCARITLAGDLPVTSGGIGASAATAVAIARAVNHTFNLNWDNHTVNAIAYAGEKAVHGTPSGIDNTAATFGKTFWFQKNTELETLKKYVPKNKHKHVHNEYTYNDLKLTHPLHIILVDSAIRSDTHDVITHVKNFMHKKPEETLELFSAYNTLVHKAHDALVSQNKSCTKNIEILGALMNQNHALLRSLGISCKKLDHMIDQALKAGALGAKLTGTGRGGLIIALAPDKYMQEKIAHEFRAHNYFVIETMVQ